MGFNPQFRASLGLKPDTTGKFSPRPTSPPRVLAGRSWQFKRVSQKPECPPEADAPPGQKVKGQKSKVKSKMKKAKIRAVPTVLPTKDPYSRRILSNVMGR